MVYTIKIRDKSEKARSIINMLKALRDENDFIEIYEETDSPDDLSVMNELESRYNSFLKDPNGKDWIEIMNSHASISNER